jgi:hypothetical protein
MLNIIFLYIIECEDFLLLVLPTLVYRQTINIIFLYIIEWEHFLLLVLPTLVQTDDQHYFSLYNRVGTFLITGTTYTGTYRRSTLFFFI